MSKRHTFEDGTIVDFDDDITDEQIQAIATNYGDEMDLDKYAVLVEAAEANVTTDDPDDAEQDGVKDAG